MTLPIGWRYHRKRIIAVCFVQLKLEWGCPNGTKYPPRQPIPNRAILPNRARLQTDGQTDRQTDRQGDSSIPPLTSLRGV